MARLASLACALALAASASASLLPISLHQVTAEDVVDTFRIASSLGSSCPNEIVHTGTVSDESPNSISHDVMTMGGRPCDDSGEMTVYAEADEVRAVVEDELSLEFFNSYVETDATFIFGVEEQGRACGGGNKFTFRKQTIIVIFNPDNPVRVGGIAFTPGRVYMVVIEPEEEAVCIYRNRVQPPGPTEPPTVTPPPSSGGEGETDVMPSATPEPEGGAGGGNGGSGAGGTGTGGGGSGGGQGPGGEVSEESMMPTPLEGDDDGDGIIESGESGFDPSESPEEEDDDSVCFPGEATVELENGSMKKMSEVELGDRVKVGEDSFSDVFMFTHKDASAVHDFVRIGTRSGESLSATQGHYIYINDGFAAAGSAKVGDVVELGDGSRTIISEVSVVKGTGLFNPQTVHGDIIVNSIRASTFTRTIEPSTAQAMLAPLRMLYDTFGISAAFLNNGADRIASVLPKGEVAL